ncbi:MAG: hypothetical protein ACYCXR_09055 [Coriobacteriia bacterium]
MAEATDVLLALGLPEDALGMALATSEAWEQSGGPATASYWQSMPDPILNRSREELFLVTALASSVAGRMGAVSHRHPWRLQFDVAYLAQVTGLMQSVHSIDSLCSNYCYADALCLARTLHSRAFALALFGFAPYLWDDWLESPRQTRYLDGQMRRELAAHGVQILPHLYEYYSELVHGQMPALFEIGHFETGLYSESRPVENSIFAVAKMLVGVMGWIGVSALVLDAGDDVVPEVVSLDGAYSAMLESALDYRRIDNLFGLIAQDRHWMETGKNKQQLEMFDFAGYRRQLGLFHRDSKPKHLGKAYMRPTD